MGKLPEAGAGRHAAEPARQKRKGPPPADADAGVPLPRWLWMALPFLGLNWLVSLLWQASEAAGAASARAGSPPPALPPLAFPWEELPLWGYQLVWLVYGPLKSLFSLALDAAMRWAGSEQFSNFDTEKVHRLERLGCLDLSYICINQYLEFLCLNYLSWLAFLSGEVPHALAEATVRNVFVGFALCLLVFDFCYVFFHGLMHHRLLYPYVHKHHHRQALPFRGSDDASNEHPLESLGGLFLIGFSLKTVSGTSGLHLLGFLLFFLVHGSLNIVNHTSYDATFWPLQYSIAMHQMHHRFPNCNYGTCTSLVDRLFGTYRPYVKLSMLE